jgi:hypothetical protein
MRATTEKAMRLTATTGRYGAGTRPSAPFYASFKGISTMSSHTSAVSALEELSSLISARCEDRSTYVNVIRIRDHVGVFSSDLQGYFMTQHAWPAGHVSVSLGAKSMTEAEDSFRLHVAQITWDGILPEHSDILPADKLDEFRYWASFQLAYRHATNVLEMESTAAHLWACEHSKEFLVAR